MTKDRFILDGQRCIICYVSARNGAILHAYNCASFKPAGKLKTTSVRVGDLLGMKR